MTTMRTLTTFSAALLLLGSAALVACGSGPDKVESPADQVPTADPVVDDAVPTDEGTEGAGGGAEEPKPDETATDAPKPDEGTDEAKPEEAAPEGEPASG